MLKELGHGIFGVLSLFSIITSSKLHAHWQSNSLVLAKSWPAMISRHYKRHFHTKQDGFEKRLTVFFQIYPYAICFNLLQSCPFMALVCFAVFVLICSVDLSCYFDIALNSLTNWPVLKLSKIAWPSPFKYDQSNLKNYAVSHKT